VNKNTKFSDPTQEDLRIIYKYNSETGGIHKPVVTKSGVVWHRSTGLCKDGYVKLGFGPKKHYEHRLVWIWHNGKIEDGLFIDHIDGDRANNRIENLRLATKGQNMSNRKLGRNNTSGFVGFCWSKNRKMWQAQINVNKRAIRLGFYDSAVDAAKAVRSAHLANGYSERHTNDV